MKIPRLAFVGRKCNNLLEAHVNCETMAKLLAVHKCYFSVLIPVTQIAGAMYCSFEKGMQKRNQIGEKIGNQKGKIKRKCKKGIKKATKKVMPRGNLKRETIMIV